MIWTLLALTTGPAHAGYGDVVQDRPSWQQRELLVLTNLVRVAPDAWDYPCNMNQWQSSERTPKAPLYFHDGLTEIAQLHSEDMERHGFMDHDSWDGTEFGDRVWPYYEGTTIGENVAWGYRDNEAAVFDGWMCSSGHRSNIMSASFDDMGGGVEDDYFTQDFGGGAGTRHVPVAMGVHSPEVPNRTVAFTATWEDAAAPTSLSVETDDACDSLVLTVGSDTRGVWEQDLDAQDDCAAYRFTWTTQDGESGHLPENGAYLYGEGCPLWTELVPDGCAPEEPEEEEPEPETDPTDEGSGGTDLDDGVALDPGSCPETPQDRNGDCERDGNQGADIDDDGLFGCATAPASGGLWLGLLALGWRRRD